MTQTDQLIEVLDARVRRREDRRDFFRQALGAAAFTAAGIAATTLPEAVRAQTAPTDVDVLNFALNLEYLEAQFYSYAAFGTGLPSNLLSGSGNAGSVRGGQQVAFSDPVVQAYAREIAQDEIAHVSFLRTALGGSAVAQPTIDVSVGPNSAFSAAAAAAGLITAGATFNPYADDTSFLLGAFIFEDVGVTAYKGAAPLISTPAYLEAAAGILAAEAYHAAIIRATLYAKGVAAPTLRTAADAISNARDSLDGSTDIDQGISPLSATTTSPSGTVTNIQVSNIAPTDSSGIAFSRSTGQVLNIVYLTRAQASVGGFFPDGLNGTIRTSVAN